MSLDRPAPVALFAFRRPEHTLKVLNALSKNDLAEYTDLYIFSDGPKQQSDVESVRRVREVSRSAGNFRSVRVVERDSNWGLARNIIDGTTETVNRYGRVIVLEDDILVGPTGLTYLNAALDKFELESRVWHVSAWNYPVDLNDVHDAFLWRVMNCWGWSTWADRWAHFDKDPQRLVDTWSVEEIQRFNLDGAHPFFDQVVANQEGSLDTWAVFWYATIFENDGLCLNPYSSLTENIGFDGTGEHGGPNLYRPVTSTLDDFKFPDVIVEDHVATSSVRDLLGSQVPSEGLARKGLLGRVARLGRSRS